MTREEKDYAQWCVDHDIHKFYIWRRWTTVREEVLRADRYECQRCKTVYKRYKKANTVHHINRLKSRPDLSLDMYFMDPATHKRERNLLSLCHDCHEEVHGYRKKQAEEKPLTEERWD